MGTRRAEKLRDLSDYTLSQSWRADRVGRVDRDLPANAGGTEPVRDPGDRPIFRRQSNGGHRAELDFPAIDVWLRHPRIALALSYLGATGIRIGANAHSDAARGRAQEVWTLRVDSNRAPDHAAGREALGDGTRSFVPGKHFVLRLGSDAAARLELFDRQFECRAHGLCI